MRGVEHNGHEELTLLELVLQLHGEFRRSLEPIRVTPLQAGVILFLCRHADAKVTDAAAALGVRLPTLSEVVKDLVRKRWVTKRRRSRIPVPCVCRSVGGVGRVGSHSRNPNRNYQHFTIHLHRHPMQCPETTNIRFNHAFQAIHYCGVSSSCTFASVRS